MKAKKDRGQLVVQCVAFLILASIAISPESDSAVLVGRAHNRETNRNEIRRINPDTGETTSLYSLPARVWIWRTFTADVKHHLLFDISPASEFEYRLHIFTLGAKVTHSIKTVNTENTYMQSMVAGVDGSPISIHYNPATEQNEIHRINLDTGETTLLNSFRFGGGAWDPSTLNADINRNRLLVVSANDTLYEFDLTTGAIRSKRALDVQGTILQGAVLAADGTMVTIHHNRAANRNEIRQVNLNTGETTRLKSFRFDGNGWFPSTLTADSTRNRMFVISTARKLYQFDMITGAILSVTSIDPRISALTVAEIDETPPTIVSTTPADGATDVPEDFSVRLDFSEPMIESSVMESIVKLTDLTSEDTITFSLRQLANAGLISAQFNEESTSLSITSETFSLKSGYWYRVEIVSLNAQDLVGNPLVLDKPDFTFRCTPNEGHTVVATHTLTVNLATADLQAKANIAVSPADNRGETDGMPFFERIFNPNTAVALTAPLELQTQSGTEVFSHWELDGEAATITSGLTAHMDADHTATAHYKTVNATVSPNTLTVGSGASATVTVTVADASGAPVSGESFSLWVDNGQIAEAPVELGGGVYSAAYTAGSTAGEVAIQVQMPNGVTIPVPLTLTEPVFNMVIPQGASLIHLPLNVTQVNQQPMRIQTVGNLFDALGGAENVSILTTCDSEGTWQSYSGEVDRDTPADAKINADTGIIAVMRKVVTVKLSGSAWGNEGVSTIRIKTGINLCGVPLKDGRLERVSDLLHLEGIRNNVSFIITADDGGFRTVAMPGDDGDGPFFGGQAYILNARAAAEIQISGVVWENAEPAVLSAPLSGHVLDTSTPLLAVYGAVLHQEEALERADLRIAITNASTGATASTEVSLKAMGEAGKFSITFFNPIATQAARVGDQLEVRVETSSTRVGVQPLRYEISPEDVRVAQVHLPNLVAYEIPANTQLLPNYPNPFNPETWIPYRLAEDAFVTLSIYDITGAAVRTIVVGQKPAAVYESKGKAIYWDGRNEFGERVASGVYFYTLTANDFSATRKMLILQ